MTFAALQTIHSLLENEKYKAEKYVEMSDYNYDQELDQLIYKFGGDEDKAYAAINGRAVSSHRDDSHENLRRITDALQEFESHDWR